MLATPITTAELLIGKSLSAVIPAVLATYAAFGIYAAGAWIILRNPTLFAAMMDARWLLAIFIAGPLMAILEVNVALMVSSRVNDPRVAEQLSMVILFPVLMVFFGQIAGLVLINQAFVIIASIVLVLLDIGLVYMAVNMFQREAILTRWK